MHVLLLTDRDWAHPQGGGTGTSIHGQVTRWVAWGHRVTVIAGGFPGAPAVERPYERLEVHRMGSRLTVFPRAAWATLRGIGRDADVVVEVVDGIAFFTPLWWWLRAPAVALVPHVHRDHDVTELGWRGRVAALVLERLPLQVLYRWRPILTISRAARDDLVALGVPAGRVHVAYLGTEPAPFAPVPKAPEPRLLYLGRLERHKRVEHVLDALEALPAHATLDVAGDGDRRAALEAEADARGLGDRVRFHGHVGEEQKAHLYDAAWVTLPASAGGWCLTVMEAADRGTPSAALAVGGLPESIVDGQTGVLGDTPQQLTREVAALMADDARREAYGAAARARARGFTWDRTAEQNLATLERAVAGGRARRRDAVRGTDTGRAAGLAAATLANNAIQLAFTIAVTRILGSDGYGALAALVSAFLILLVGGQSAQAAAAREAALGRLGPAEITAWTRRLLVATGALAVVGVLVREPLAGLIGVGEHPWGAAALLPTGAIWVLLSLQRGVLQGLGQYRAVGVSIIAEALSRFVLGAALAATLSVTGAFLATPLGLLAVIAWLSYELRAPAPDAAGASGAAARTPRKLRSLVSDGWVPIVGLLLLAVLQNVDVIIARHELGEDGAGSYAVAAVAAKSVMWVAIGVGLMLLPQATRRAAAGLDPRPVLLKALAVLAAVAAPALLVFVLVPGPLLRLAFDDDGAADALGVLGVAMTLLAVAYLTVQYMLALRVVRFLWVLLVVAAAEIVLLLGGSLTITGFALTVLAVQTVTALAVLAMGSRAMAWSKAG